MAKKDTTKKTAEKKDASKKSAPTMLDRMIAAAEDINTTLGMEPTIDLDMSESDLEKELREIATDDVEEGDALSKDTWALFAEWGVGPLAGDKKEGEEAKEQKAAPKDKAKAGKAKKDKKASKTKEGMAIYIQEVLGEGLGDRHEDEVVVQVKEKFPEKSYRVIGNAIYAAQRKLAK